MWTARRWLVLFGAVAVATVALIEIYGVGAVGVSGQYDLLWGAQLANGDRAELDAPFAPTSHPLTIALGSAVAFLGGATVAMSILQFIALAGMLVAVWLFAEELFDRYVATLSLLLLALFPLLLSWSFDGLKHSLWIAALAVAGRAELRTPRAGGAVLWPLGILGLVRPEAWALAGLYCAYLWWDPARRRAIHAAGALAPPALWMAFDLAMTGDALSSLHHTTALRGDLERETGLIAAVTSLPGLVEDVLGGVIPLLAALGAILVLAAGQRRVAGVLAVAAVLVASFVGQSAVGFSVIPNYLAPVDILLVVFAAAALLAPLHLRTIGRRRALAAVAALAWVGVAAHVPDRLDRHDSTRADLRALAESWTDLAAVVSRGDADATCGPVDLSGPYAPRPLLALHLDRPVKSLRDATITQPRRGLHIVPTDPEMGDGLSNLAFVRREPRRPPGARLLRRNITWSVWERCA